MLMAHNVNQLAMRTPGKEAAAMESYANALRQVSTILTASLQDEGLHLFTALSSH